MFSMSEFAGILLAPEGVPIRASMSFDNRLFPQAPHMLTIVGSGPAPGATIEGSVVLLPEDVGAAKDQSWAM
jgi:hypothetical protein